jgi:hypothetical protein
MIDLMALTVSLAYNISQSPNGITIKFDDNYTLIKFYQLTNPYKSFYHTVRGQEYIYLYKNVIFGESNSNTNTIYYKCDVEKVTKKEFIPYLRKEKIKDIWNDINVGM